MNDIEHNKAQCWCNRLHKLMKEKNYTQKSFLKEYKEKYGGGTQANISRWLHVGSKIENGKTIGFPSYETMSNLADFFGVSVGYLNGETDYESFEMEKVCEFLGLEEETVKAFSHSNGIKILAKYKLKIVLNHVYASLSDMMYHVYPNLCDKLEYYQHLQDGRYHRRKNGDGK